MRLLVATLGILLGLSHAAQAGQPNDFSYYLLALSWSPQYCATDARPGDAQCRQPRSFIAHGLWPQKERGYPQDCGVGKLLSAQIIDYMLPIMPSKRLITHQWQKHGVCTRLTAESYFDNVTRAYRRIKKPREYLSLERYKATTVTEIKSTFIAANPQLKDNMLVVQCDGNYLQEVRVCMSLSLEPLTCGKDVRDRCGGQVVLRPPRKPN